MPTFVNTETGESFEGDHACPKCSETQAEAERQVTMLERDLRSYRSKVSRLESQVERDAVQHRDKALWTRILEKWTETFPKTRITAKGYKSARATAVFLRIEQGATEEDFMDAIAGARSLPYIVYGKRVATGSKSDLAIDLTDIASVKDDRKFDALVTAGRALRAA